MNNNKIWNTTCKISGKNIIIIIENSVNQRAKKKSLFIWIFIIICTYNYQCTYLSLHVHIYHSM